MQQMLVACDVAWSETVDF